MDMDQYICFGDVVVDLSSGRISRAGRELELEPRTFEVLVYLLKRPDRLVPHGELLREVWRGAHVTSHSLTQAISQLRQVLEDDPHQPRFVETVHRRGYRWLAPVLTAATQTGPDRPATVLRKGLPAATVELIGRESLLGSLPAALLGGRQVTLIGPGGAGKTQVALEVGRRVGSFLPDGVLLVDLTTEDDGLGVARALARQLGIDPGESTTALGALAAALRDRILLLILDNCEHVALPVASLIVELLATCPAVRILATSQRSLAIPGQHLIRVPPLELPPAGWTSAPGDLPHQWPESVRLFTERARAVNPDFRVTEENAGAIAEICRRLDGIPLALELAAARTNVMTPGQIAARLDERLQLLTSPHPAAQSRHMALPAMIDWSVSLLAEPVRKALERLSVFRGGWTLEAAQAVIGEPGTTALVDDLASMADKSLIVVDVQRQQPRFRLLDSIHFYLQEHLARSAQHALIRDRHLDCFLRFSEDVERAICSDPVTWIRRVRDEHANLKEALAWALADPRHAEHGLRICCNLRWAWRIEGSYVESRDWLREALAAAPGAPPPLVGKALVAFGLIHHHRGEFEEARVSVRNGLALLPPEERWERAFGAMLLAFNETLGGSPDEAEALAATCEREIEALGDDRLLGFARLRSAMAAGLRSQCDEAVRLLLEAVGHLQHGQDPFLLSFTKVQIGLQQLLSGHTEAARDAALGALHDGCELDNLRLIAGGIEILAYLAIEEQNALQAARLLGAASRLRETTSAPVLANFSKANSRACDRLRERLGRETFALEFEHGIGTPLAEVLEPLLPR